MPRSVLFIDNGGYTIKALYLPAPPSQANAAQPSPGGLPAPSPSLGGAAPAPKVFIMPNCVGAAPHAGTGIMGDQLTRLPHYHGLMVRRPVDRGFIVDGGLQARIWEHVLQHFAIEQEEDVDVWLTVPFASPKAVAELLWLLCTRSFHFGSVTMVSSSFMSLIGYSFHVIDRLMNNRISIAAGDAHPAPREKLPTNSRKRTRGAEAIAENLSAVGAGGAERGGTAIVVDVGFSCTTIVPYIDFLPVVSSAIRLDIGGKLLTNRLKEFLSYFQVNVMEDTWLINYVRERCCVVALQPWKSLQRYAAMGKGKSREKLQAALAQGGSPPKRSNTSAIAPATTTTTTTGRRGVRPTATSDGNSSSSRSTDNEEATENAGVLPITADAADTPVRYYLPTIPALLPLGVLEAELPLRLPKTTAVDSTALQHLLLCQERFLIPELLFTPGDVGLDQHGLSQAITESIFQRGLLQHVVTLLRPQLLKRVCLYGGVADTPLLCARLHNEVRAVSPVGAEDADEDNHEEADNPDDVEDARRGGVEAPPPLPALLEDTIAAAVAASGGLAGESSPSPFSRMTLQPLIGAFHLLSADAASTAAAAQRLVQLRGLVQKRSRVELQHPVGGRVTVETFQEAMRCMS
ncbi:putative actin-like protein [Leptomonas seymouri]|uniref:Putative actin-like protein n=1 Tax=Leptomonas seymouri TaxID=5684 RepID=A0A0N0P4I4_LEPSE|nr:putative actin-like protein [Leptomonas seymouri]|eukprot:KPI85336.1 putative actin-like protein [Leptomonas seymouri]